MKPLCVLNIYLAMNFTSACRHPTQRVLGSGVVIKTLCSHTNIVIISCISINMNISDVDLF